MTEAERAPIVQAARQIALDVQGGRTADLKAATVPAGGCQLQQHRAARRQLTPP